MRHDPNLARAAALLETEEPAAPPRPSVGEIIARDLRAALTSNCFDGICFRLGILALVLVPGRAIVVLIWPAAAPSLGFGQ